MASIGDPIDAVLERLDDGFDVLRRRFHGDAALAAFLIAPAALILGAFGIAPIFSAIHMSLYSGKHGMGPFAGFGNYVEALTSHAFWRSFLVTVYYAAGVIPVAMTVSFAIAYALYRITVGRGLFRVLYFLPYVTSAVASAMIWRALFNVQGGLFNLLLESAGFEPQQWLLEPRGVLHLLSHGWIPPEAGPSLALCCIMIFDIWHGCGFMVVVFLAGLSSIPRELEEAARIDGAGTLRVIRHVTLPLLSPTVFFLAVVSTVKSFQAFNSFYALTQGGSRALGTTENLVMHLYTNFYDYGYWGYGAAVATLLCAAIILLTLAQWRFVERRVHYE
jgi:multiple sugar transport system permease protein